MAPAGACSSRRRPTALGSALLILLVACVLPCCSVYDVLDPEDETTSTFIIEGRLARSDDYGCLILRTTDGAFDIEGLDPDVHLLGARAVLLVREFGATSFRCAPNRVKLVRTLFVIEDFRKTSVTESEIWDAEHGPIPIGDVEVEVGATLTIRPGTDVQIVPGGGLHVRGQLVAEGTADRPVSIRRLFEEPGWRSALEFLSSERLSSLLHAETDAIGMSGAALTAEDLSAPYLLVQDSVLRGGPIDTNVLHAIESSVELSGSDLGYVVASHSTLWLNGSLIGALDVVDAVLSFNGNRLTSSVTMDGACSGAFTHNTFSGWDTSIQIPARGVEVMFAYNNFVGRFIDIFCRPCRATPCVSMAQNWWGTADADSLRTLLWSEAACYEPWLTAPDPLAPGSYWTP